MAQPQSLKPSTQPDRLTQLRALAQSHLTEIDQDKTQEEAQLIQAKFDNQKYIKMGSSERKKLAKASKQQQSQHQSQSVQQHQQQPTPSIPQDIGTMDVTKKQRFRPFPEILHRLQWDPKLNINEYVVGYIERFDGIKEMPASSWIRDFSDEEWIPMHRVRYVKRVRKDSDEDSEDEAPELGTVWDRDGRVDMFARNREDDVPGYDVLSMDGTSVTGGVMI